MHSAVASEGMMTMQPNAAAAREDSMDDQSATIPRLHSRPLRIFPFSMIARSYLVTSISSSTWLLPPSLALMNFLAHTNIQLLNPDKNPLLKYVIKNTFYKQFCAGETPTEVTKTMDGLKEIGFCGVILGYAREAVISVDEQQASLKKDVSGCTEEQLREEITPWMNGNMQTIRLANPGDYVAIKYTGAGPQTVRQLLRNETPSPLLKDSMDTICQEAKDRGVKLLIDAEQRALQDGIDAWALELQTRYNRDEAVVFGTYQAYLKSTPETLYKHMQAAREAGYVLGVKLVRGAYLGSDPRQLIHDTKEATDEAYNGIAKAIIQRSFGPPLPGRTKDSFPNIELVLASHNAETVRIAQCHERNHGRKGTKVTFGQLQGMADELSCSLVLDKKRVFKYLVWGSTGECMKYLLRRAQENRDAVARTKSSQKAVSEEFWSRLLRR